MTATQICTLPEQAPRTAGFPRAAAFYEPPRGGEPVAPRLTEEHEAAAA